MSSTTVLGAFPGYIALSDKIGARRFELAPSVWGALSATAQWDANRHFLDSMVAAGDTFVLSINPRLARPGTWLFRELRHLRARRIPGPATPVWTQ